MVGTALPERPRCGHASLWWKPGPYQELEGPTATSFWGQAAMGPRCGVRSTKCQLLVTSLCVMVSRQLWGDLCRTGLSLCLCHAGSERGWFSHVLFLAGGGQAQPTARVIIAPGAVIAGHQHRPPSSHGPLVSQGCHTTAALSQLSSCLQGERKGRCWQNGWFSAKRYLLLSPWSKRGRMDLLWSRLLLGGWSTADGISEEMKLQGFGGSVCGKPVD